MPVSNFETFSPPAPPGLKLAYEIMTLEEEAQLIGRIQASGLADYAYDAANPRSSMSYGWKYDFRDDSFVACAPTPEGFGAICETAARFAGVEPGDLAECLLNRYDPGAIIQWHFDKPVWEHVVGISLGAAATMEFRKATADGCQHAAVELRPRSIYLLSGEARHAYQHSLLPVDGTRWSITFRSFSDVGLKLRDSGPGRRAARLRASAADEAAR